MAFLSAIVAWSLKNRAVVVFAVAVLVAFGLRAAATLPIDAVPDVTNIQVQIITSAPALGPTEIEQYVTIPVERAMSGTPRSRQIRSISKHGLSVVSVVFDEDTDVHLARQLVGERMREVSDTVRYGKPELGPISTGLGEIYQFVVRNERMTPMELEGLLRWEIGPRLRTVPGVVEVNGFGGHERQYQVAVDPKRLAATGVSVDQVVSAIERSNENAGGGYLARDREQVVVGSQGLVKSVDDLANVVVSTTADGTPITVGTIGTAKLGPRLRLGSASMDGKGEVVVGVTLMLMGENAREVTRAVHEKVDEIRKTLPEGTTIEPFYERSVLVERTTRTVVKNLVEGALLVIGILLLLLGDWRAGLVVAATIPLALLFAIIAMRALGLSGNLMSLGAIDFGLIVDGAVIVIENVVRRIDDRQKELGRCLEPGERTAVTEEATLEVRKASVYGELIIAIVYLPIVALTGVEGKLFRPMATTVLLALLGAFFLTLTFVPVLASLVVKRPLREGHHETWIVRVAHRAFTPILARAVRHPVVTVSAALALVFAGGLLFTRIGAEFVPQLDEGDLLVEVRRLPGVSLAESISMDRRMQAALLEIPEIEHAVSKTGAPVIATDPMGIEQTDVYLAVKDRDRWRPGLDKDALAREITDLLAERVPEVATAISQPIQLRTNELLAGARSDVVALIYGRDLEELARLGERVAGLARAIPGAVDVRVEQVEGLPHLKIVPDRARRARHGLGIEDVNLVTRTLAVGAPVGEVLDGDRRHSIVVLTDHGFEGDLEPLRAIPLRTPSGKLVPLGDVAELSFTTGPAQVSREGLSRRLSVELNVRGRDMISVVGDLQAAIDREVPLPAGYRVEYGGQFESYVEARARLAIVVPIALATILFILWTATGSMATALVVFLGVPFAAVGGVAALAVREIPFSISAGVGFVALSGVAVLNGLVLVSFAHHLEDAGVAPGEAIRRAAEVRLRPVLTTALVASLGFVPMAISTAPGAEVQRPLATVVIGGLITATALTLLVLPVVYARVRSRATTTRVELPRASGA